MIDAHVHLEKGSYTLEWVEQFIRYAQMRNIDEVFFLEHTHIFKECSSLYAEMAEYNDYQRTWYHRKRNKARPINDYIEFVESLKQMDLPVRLRFGLEVCYSPEHEEDINQIKQIYPFDFYVGSVHFIDGWAFSHGNQRWDVADYNIEKLYNRYYTLMLSLAKSALFSGLAHPQSLQCFGAYPPNHNKEIYLQLARALYQSGMYVEESSGLAINYGDSHLGMNHEMLEIMMENKVSVLTASDAHYPNKVGLHIQEMEDIIRTTNQIIKGQRIK